MTEQTPWSFRMADSALSRMNPAAMRWHYEDGLLIRAIAEVARVYGAWPRTDQPAADALARYRRAAADYTDRLIGPDGTIHGYRLAEYNLDQILPGRLLFGAYRATSEARYRQALGLLREQLRGQPRTAEGGFWHKLIYPHQMWLDGIYMAGPFLAQYGVEFGEEAAFDEVTRQVLLIARHALEPGSGLLYHGWDESRQQRWADPQTGCSPHFWGRAMGWFLMAIVDVLDFLPPDHPRRSDIAALFRLAGQAVCTVQDAASGLWYQVLDHGSPLGSALGSPPGSPPGSRRANYLEASASCMFVYSLAKGIRCGYLPDSHTPAVRLAFQGILARLIEVDAAGMLSLTGTCGVAGLGGTPYRDGSFEYYVNEPAVTNDYKGVGPFILAALEMEQAGDERP